MESVGDVGNWQISAFLPQQNICLATLLLSLQERLNASQTLISSRPNPTKKLEENPVPLPEEWLPFPPTPVLFFFFFFFFW